MFFRHTASALAGYVFLPSFGIPKVASAAVSPRRSARNCIFVFLDGGASHVDTFDLKEGSWLPSTFLPATFGDIRFPQGIMPKLASQLDSLAFVRSMKAYASVHGLAKTWVQIGRNPISGNSRIAPHIGSVVSLELGKQEPNPVFPAFVALNTGFGSGAGYLPTEFGPFYVSPGGSGLANNRHPDGTTRFDRRTALVQSLDNEIRTSADVQPAFAESFSWNAAARKLMANPDVDKIFTFAQDEKNRYGNTSFGNACIAARNLLRAKSGVRFIQITQGGWDNHDNIYTAGKGHSLLMPQLDSGLGTLISDLKSDGLFDDTLIVALGEFGRIPGPLNTLGGRDHHLVQSVLFAGGGVKGKTVIGATDSTGKNIVDFGWSRKREVRAEDIEATIYSALGIDWTTVRRDDPLGRGFEYVPFSDQDLYGPVNELWG